MSILLGTDLGLFKVNEVPFEAEDAEQIIDCGMVTSLRSYEYTDNIYVTSTEGAYRLTDEGESWEDLNAPMGSRFWYGGESQYWSILETIDGTLYAGTNDPYLYRSDDEGSTWTELRGFRKIPSRGVWESPIDPHYARLRTLEQTPGNPDRIIAGVEAGGVHISEDRGRTWIDGRERIPDDIHQVLPIDADVYLAAVGHLDLDVEHLGLGHAVGNGGVYRTVDAGESWHRLDPLDNEFDYVRRVFVHDGRLYFCGSTTNPTFWVDRSHEIALFESDMFGQSWERKDFPGAPENIEAWSVMDGNVICASGYVDIPDRQDINGTVMRRTDDGEYEEIGRAPGNPYGLIAL